MSISKFVAIVLACALMGAAPARAVEYFFDDFETGDMAGWTDLDKHVGALKTTPLGLHGWSAIAADPDGEFLSRAAQGLADTNLADTVYFSWQFSHTGGYLGRTEGIGWKHTTVWLVDDTGQGYGVQLAYDKENQGGAFEMQLTEDFGATVGHSTWGAVSGGILTLPPGIILLNDFSEHSLQIMWDRANATMDMYLDGTWLNTVTLDPSENAALMNPTQVVLNPRNCPLCPYSDGLSGLMTADNIWLGDVPNPNAPDPILAGGDTDGNLKVDIVDLTALAANWSALSPGGKDWTQADFNFDWTVDIVDLTALAANWTFGPGSAPPDAVPEPTTMALFALTAIGLLRRRR